MGKEPIRRGQIDSLLMQALAEVLTAPRSPLVSAEGADDGGAWEPGAESGVRGDFPPAGSSLLPSVRRIRPEDVVSFKKKLTKPGITVLEEAIVYKYHEEQGWTHQQIAEEYGKHRTHVSNTIGILALPREVLDALATPNSGVTMGHARALKAIRTMPDIVRTLLGRIIEERLSVRWLENYIRDGEKHGWHRMGAQGAGRLQENVDEIAYLVREAGATVHAEVEFHDGALVIRTASPAHAAAILKRLCAKG